MGYNTDFSGQFNIEPPLTAKHRAELVKFSETRHEPPHDMDHSYYCQWIPDEDGTAIVWDEGEKFYSYVEWLQYIIDKFLKPWGHVLNGNIEWCGEENEDSGVIYVKDNRIQAIRNQTIKPEPKWD